MRELEPNLERLIRAAELPDPDDRLDAACSDFLSRLERPQRRRRALPVAAAAVGFAAVLGVVLTPAPQARPGPAVSTPAVQEDILTQSLAWLVRRQNADGSWGAGRTRLEGVWLDKPGVTGLVLLSLLGAGYSHLSKDRVGDRKMGDVMAASLRWLMDDQREDGGFRTAFGTPDQAIAAEALAEAYGLTGSHRFKDSAAKSVRALEGMQAQDGAWGDAATTYWAAGTSYAAEIAGLEFSAEARARLLAFYDRRNAPDAGELIVRVMFGKHRKHPAVKTAAEALRAASPAAVEPIHPLLVRAHAAFLYDGASGDLWEGWRGPLKASVLSRLDKQGGWTDGDGDERIVRTSLAALCLEILYRYENLKDAKPAVGADK